MVADPLTLVGTRVPTLQTIQVRDDQVENNAGGFVFALDDMARARRFLILGTESPTYYTSAPDLTRDNAKVIVRLAAERGSELVDLIVDVSLSGRAPKQNPTLFALAVCCASPDMAVRAKANAAIGKVCRTGTHLFIFARYVEQFRGWGRGLRRAVADWYRTPEVDRLAYQAVKYRQREGWSHRDLLRLSHPRAASAQQSSLFDWICRPDAEISFVPRIVEGFRRAQGATPKECARLVADYGLPWEALPDAALDEPSVWEALLPGMGLTALIRQLGRLTRLGVVAPMSESSRLVSERVCDMEALRRARVHPLTILSALATYASGHGMRGSQTWQPVPAVVGALDQAFYRAFGVIEPAHKRTLVALDVSGSMAMGTVAGSPLAPFQAEAAMAMTVVRTEPTYHTMAFSGGFVPLPLTPNQRLDDVLRTMNGMPFDRTDCAVPIMWAARSKVPVDTFVIYTDNETWSGAVHPFRALQRYRDIMGIPARLAVVGMTSTGFSIADPSDPGMLDLVGFDTAAPELLAGFSRGEM